jgi:hypothetical protein
MSRRLSGARPAPAGSVTYRFRYALSYASPARTALPAVHFELNPAIPASDLVR